MLRVNYKDNWSCSVHTAIPFPHITAKSRFYNVFDEWVKVWKSMWKSIREVRLSHHKPSQEQPLIPIKLLTQNNSQLNQL